MRLLITTQTLDQADPTLGFFVAWVRALADRVEHVDVICLKEGEYVLPANVAVHSLGKESMRAPSPLNRLIYLFRFYRYVFTLRYDRVFVHMNQEYVLLAGDFWRLTGRRVFLWRNHYDGSFLTSIAALMANKVFYTSRYSYTARARNAVQMPVGVDIDSLHPEIAIERTSNSILFLARLDISKRPELVLHALALLSAKGVPYTASFVGGSSDTTGAYVESLKELAASLNIADRVTFTGPVPNTETFRAYRSHEVFVNASRSGMLDKTTYKAMAAGCLILSSSDDLRTELPADFIYEDGDANDLAEKLERLLSMGAEEKRKAQGVLADVAERNSLPILMDRLLAQMN